MGAEMKYVPLAQVKKSETNTRKHIDEVKLAELTESIKARGVINPILIRPVKGNFEVVCGERRYLAALKAGLKEIPAFIREMTDMEALEFQIIENLQREDVHPLEEAEGYEVLMKKHGCKTVDDLAAKVGKSKGYIYGRMKLCELIPENRKYFYSGKFSPSVSLLVARIPAHLQKEAGRKIAEPTNGDEPMSYRRAKEFITNEYMLRLKDAPFDTDDAMLPGVEAGSCTLCQKRTGNQHELFADVSSADVCIDPACFKLKKAAAVKQALVKAKAAGKIILSDKDAKKVFYGEDSMHLGEGYINLETVCTEDKLQRKYKQLVKAVKDVKVVVGINPHSGELVAMVHRTEAARVRKQLGIVPEKPAREKKKAEKKQKAEAVEAEKQQEAVQKECDNRILESVLENVRRDRKSLFLRKIAEREMEGASESLAFRFMKRRDPDIKREDAKAKLREHLDVIDDAELFVFIIEVMILVEEEWGEGQRLIKDLSKLYNIDTAKIKKAATPAAVEAVKDEQQKEEPAASAATEAVKTPEKVRIKKRDAKTFEFTGKKGKVTVTSKTDMSFKEAEEAGDAISQVADIMAEDK